MPGRVACRDGDKKKNRDGRRERAREGVIGLSVNEFLCCLTVVTSLVPPFSPSPSAPPTDRATHPPIKTMPLARVRLSRLTEGQRRTDTHRHIDEERQKTERDRHRQRR